MTRREACELWVEPSGPESERLFYRHWPAASPSEQALLVLHRGHEHSGRMADLVRDLDLAHLHVFAWDARGHGRSPGVRGDAPSVGTLVRDVERFARWLEVKHGIKRENLAVLGHSVGAVLAALWVHDYAPPIRALVLATPALQVRLYVPFARTLLSLRNRLLGPGFVKSYVKASMLTHDREQAAAYRADPQIFRQISVRVLLGLHAAGQRLIADAGAIHAPTLLLSAGSDWVVDNGAQRRFFAGLGTPRRRWEVLPGSFHAVYHERERARPIATTRAFLDDAFARDGHRPDLIAADRYSHTQEEHARLSLPLSKLTPRGLGFALQRLFLRTIGRLSQGIRLGWRTGFDSGATLDYVYENRPRGITLLGWLIDKVYLGAPGWRGIRTRREHLQQALGSVLERLAAQGRPLHVVDLAAGHGRYVLTALRDAATRLGTKITAVLRDYDPSNVAAAAKLAQELGVTGVTCERGDAFERSSIPALDPKPTVGVVSGLYELFPANARVQESLAGLADAIAPGGFLIYTNQPWHPQLEFIARVLVNREGRPWIMRRRTNAEMDALVQTAGFAKREMLIDEDGIFTVSIAERT